MQIFVNVSEFFQVINIVFVSCNIEAQVFSRQLIQLFQVNVIAQIVALEGYNVFLSMLVEFLENFLKLFRSLEYVRVI